MTHDLPPYLRARGAVLLRCAPGETGSKAVRVRQEGALNLRFPRGGDGLEAVLVNIAGGVVGGDRYAATIAVEAGAAVTVSTAAAEKIYRSAGETARIEVDLAVAGRLDWLPQETILFDRARLARRLHADVTEDATLLAAEMIMLGRSAMGERVANGFMRDDWRIRRGGRLIYADALRLDGDVAALLRRRATADDASSLATVLYVGRDAEARLAPARIVIDKLRSSACDVAASAWDGVLVVRWLAHDARAMRVAMVRFLEDFRDAAMPRVWAT